MRWFLDLQIRFKLLGGFLLLAMIAGGISWIGISKIQGIGAVDKWLYEKREPKRKICRGASPFSELPRGGAFSVFACSLAVG